jgi:valyl-tRNA synthetase
LSEFRLSEALKNLYTLIWDDFCSWYLEWVKPAMDQPIDKMLYEKSVDFFERLMQLLHPFMPFITEEIYHELKRRSDDLTVKQNPAIAPVQQDVLSSGNLLKELITAIRDSRNRQQLKPRDPIKLHILTGNRRMYEPMETILKKQVNAGTLSFTDQPVSNCITIVAGNDKLFIETFTTLDNKAHRELLQKERDYLRGFLESVEKKLQNQKFVQNAKPEVLEFERKKKADAESKIKAIEESLSNI